MAVTKTTNLIDPEVMADIISGKIEAAVAAIPYAKVDNTLAAQPGTTITVPKYAYIGDAVDVAEGGQMPERQLTATPETYTVKKAGNGVTLTDEVLLSSYGNPRGETASQLAKSIESKVDTDCIAALLNSNNVFNGSTAIISYNGIVDAIDLFDEEVNHEKVMFINPKQLTQLRKDANFISADKYTGEVVLTGEVGMIAGTHIVPSRRIVAESGVFSCPIAQIETDERTEDSTPALTIYTKRDVLVESERDTHTKTTYISADQHYVAALTNETKVVVAKFKEK